MPVDKVDAERILDVLTSHVDGDWNDGLECYVSASHDGETLKVTVTDDDEKKKVFYLTVESD
ncbi:hypothetical protein SEA_WOFFORD_134 [Streptomyces phage Wofford]|uniref:Tudor domain-containing protein n=1 Tax=Streptomyces phage Wofford TaxID=2283267 RepID=A0A345M9Y4_9CAUD|nr:hypothetical protein HWB78_gp150 [Streptomyces phage Wollford]AXH67305.1 hypothetical protein SEA_WOFFORD_134 [Streptomyces phage Wollford]